MTVVIAGTRDRQLVADVKRLARRVGRDLKTGHVTVNVVFVTNRYIHGLNRRYLRRDRPTDVMAFPMADSRWPTAHRDSEIGNLLGEVYVSRDQARLQARDYGVSCAGELRRLVLHGLLHLCGLTHRQMERYERRYLGYDRGRGTRHTRQDRRAECPMANS